MEPIPAPAQRDPTAQAQTTAFYRALAEQIRANLERASDPLGLCLERLRQLVLPDPADFYLRLEAAHESGCVVLRGETERGEFRDLALGVLRQLGFGAVTDRVEVVPDLELQPAPFGVAVASHLLTWSQPGLDGREMDEALYGEPVYILKDLRHALLIKTLTGYWGYADPVGIRRVDRASFVRLLNSPMATVLQDHPSGELTLPTGCRLPIVAWPEGPDVLLSDASGDPIRVPKAICRREDRERAMLDLVQFAGTFRDVPYQFGGKNQRKGIDCSGLIQLAFRTLGVNLPRDARQQYLGGHLILPCVREALLPGDALFFMNSQAQVDHVALCVGPEEVLHATGNQVRLDSLRPGAKNYLRRLDHEFLGAKRFFG
jgi:hypothetical protein